MADPNDVWPDNVGGSSTVGGKRVAFYVDRECILCSVCSECAPESFRMSDDGDHDICFKQPADERELRACYDAMANCPVEAIGDDGPG
ncbi:MAG: ferredoxin [Myxococcales bacterium]|nr:ferredoxin [Myxococcales bacterium]MCB9668991.1 ferredoxin [Alphaproteobacteria bacterium]MCB9691318.1 ferredoxin [Alphaproteobacteria bacterium]